MSSIGSDINVEHVATGEEEEESSKDEDEDEDEEEQTPVEFHAPPLCVTMRCVRRAKYWLIIMIPVCYLPLITATESSLAGKCAYMLAVMLNFYLWHLMPPFVIALFPVFMAPLLQFFSSRAATALYFQELTVMMLCSMIAATGIMHSNLYTRFVLLSLLTTGPSPRWLLMGFMFPTMFISMVATNTASCTRVIELATKVFNDLEIVLTNEEFLEALAVTYPEKNARSTVKRHMKNIRNMIFIGVAFASSIGGIGTLTGTGTNLVLLGILEDIYPDKDFRITYLTWLVCSVPMMLINFCGAWLILQLLFVGFRNGTLGQNSIMKILRAKYRKLGDFSCHEFTVLILFSIMIILWISYDPLGNDKGWVTWFYHSQSFYIGYTVPAVLIVCLLFVFPATCNCWCRHMEDTKLDGASTTAIRWIAFHKWINNADSLIIIGSGRIIAMAVKVSGLEDITRPLLEYVQVVPDVVMLMIVLFLTSALTTLLRNVACATMILPILVLLQKALDIPVLFFLYPATINCSFAFMLPGSTPPNTVAWASGHVQLFDMLKAGLLVWLLSLVVLILATYFYVPYVIDMSLK